jgi:5-hydroxyisourate hydrolase
MTGRLTTHVLDTTQGRPGWGVVLDLFRLHAEDRIHLVRKVNNADGRCDAPLLEGQVLAGGGYELVFHVGDYFRAQGIPVEPVFLDLVPIRFQIADPRAHYHIPLLVSPYGYTTYRGS